MTQLFFAIIATSSFCILFNIEKKHFLWASLSGGIAWGGFILSGFWGFSSVIGYFIGAVGLSIYALVLSHIRKTPVTIFLIPGIIPIVPGAGMYKTLYAVVTNDYQRALSDLFITLQLAGSIAIGILFVTSIYGLIRPNRPGPSNAHRPPDDIFPS